jgi:hypothetical protein
MLRLSKILILLVLTAPLCGLAEKTGAEATMTQLDAHEQPDAIGCDAAGRRLVQSEFIKPARN